MRVGYAAQDALVLHIERQVQGVYALLESADGDSVLLVERIVFLLEGIEEADLSRAEEARDCIYEPLLTLDSLRVPPQAGLLLSFLFLLSSKLLSDSGDVSRLEQRFLLSLLALNRLFCHVLDSLAEGPREVLELDKVASQVDPSIDTLGRLRLPAAALDAESGQQAYILLT